LRRVGDNQLEGTFHRKNGDGAIFPVVLKRQ
jgi:hypothetical protein